MDAHSKVSCREITLSFFSRQQPLLRSERDSLINHPIINNANMWHSANLIFFVSFIASCLIKMFLVSSYKWFLLISNKSLCVVRKFA